MKLLRRLFMPNLFLSFAGEGEGGAAGAAGEEEGAGGSGAGEGAGEGAGGEGGGGESYQVPETYREQAWAKDIKSEEDVYKQLQGAQELIGKKSLPPKFEDMTEQQVEDYNSSTRPEKWEDYEMPESFTPTEKELYGKALHEEGISGFKAKRLMAKLEAQHNETKETTFGEKGWKEILKTSFGDEFETKGGEVTGFIKKNAVEADQKLIEAAPNEVLGAFYRIIDNVKKAYGANEAGTGAAAPGTSGVVDKAAQQKVIRDKIVALNSRPHTQAEKDVLIKELSDSYK